MRARLVLQDGTVYVGRSFGAEGTTDGEVVFNTSMTGYQEILTDPSYCGQIVTMTYPHIGNYGVNREDIESARPNVAGFVVREYSKLSSNFRSEQSLNDYLRNAGIIGIEEVDTRALTRKIRITGAMPGLITTTDESDAELRAKAASLPGMGGQNLVPKVTCKKSYEWRAGMESVFSPHPVKKTNAIVKVVVIDCGAKQSILRWLVESGCDLTVVPAGTTAEEILAMNPHGVFLSNGPGDPAVVHDVIAAVKGLLERKPIFGICLGHQILSLALGAETFKLKFGHRGGNQPVQDVKTKHIGITAQNHGFAVRPESLEGTGLRVTEINLNDRTIEGVEHEELPVFAVQYHPEAGPGPHDATHLFARFTEMLRVA
ncbi:MAG TPA: glutamine-hydrolyzing carbamoyl-phosphate synthase small subunit [Candidatus Brocadiia bacterium]|nr:glutamine-hydrolyzing carbamoyl-phosphate synthase small subunit [Candidatus Brocadiia bacterium]